MYPGMYRHAFTDDDRRKMIDFLYRRILEVPQFASRTCGTILWADFIKYMRWNRTPMNVSSHFRKVVKPKLYSFNNEPEKVLYCMKAMQCDVLIHEQNTIARLYSKYDITYKLKYGKYIIDSYTLKDTSDNHANENGDVDVTNVDESSSDEQGHDSDEIERGRREAEKRRCPHGWYSKQQRNRSRMAWLDESDESESDGPERRPNDERRNMRQKSPAKNTRPTVASTSAARGIAADDSPVRNILQSPRVTSPPAKRARNGRRANDEEEAEENIRETPPPEVSRSRPSYAESAVHDNGVDALLDEDATMNATGVVEEAADDCVILQQTQDAGVDSLLAMNETIRDLNTEGGTGVAFTSNIANRDAAIPVAQDANTEGDTSIVAAAATIDNCCDSVIQIRDSNTEGAATAVAATATTANCDVAVQVDVHMKNVSDAACNTDFLMMTISAEDDSWLAFFTEEHREERVKRLKIPRKVEECFFTLAGSEMEYLYNLELAAPLAAFNNETGYKKQFKRKKWKMLCEVSREDEAEIFIDCTRYMEYALRMINCAATNAARAAGNFNLPIKYWAGRLCAVLVDDAAAPGRFQRRIAKAKRMGGATAEVGGAAGEGGGASGEGGGASGERGVASAELGEASGEGGGTSGVFCILEGFTISADRAHRLDNLIVETVREAKDMPAEQMNERLSVFYYQLKLMIRLHQEIEAIKKDGPAAFLSARQYPGRLPWLPYPDGKELFEVEEGDEEGGREEEAGEGVENANAANGAATRETQPSPEL